METMTISVKLWDRLTYKHDVRDIAEAKKILERVDGDMASYILEATDEALHNGAKSEAWANLERIARMMNVKSYELVSFWFIMTSWDVWDD
jgi:hypothetical protein